MFLSFRRNVLFVLFIVPWMYKTWCFGDPLELYTAAVLEFIPFDDLLRYSPTEIVQKNLDVYKEAIETASRNNVDIIVFPEYGIIPPNKGFRPISLALAENIPDPKLNAFNPCVEESLFSEQKILRTLSCLAQNNNIYIVANVLDKKPCGTSENVCPLGNTTECGVSTRECKPDGFRLFNTNVAFNRNGTLLLRYYKQHLFYESDKDYPENPENAYFETEFGLFTTFVCFDICFKEAINAIEERNAKNVAFPTYWLDFVPSVTALQFHQAWAITNKVNLLSSNVHVPGRGAIGSGIYSGTRGALIYTFDPNTETMLLISEVPSNPQNPALSSKSFANKIFNLKDEKFVQLVAENESSEIVDHCSRKVLGFPENVTKDYRCHELNLVDNGAIFKKLEKPSDSIEICNNNLCCSLKYNTSFIADDYRLMSYSSPLFFSDHNICLQGCVLIRCDDFFSEPCSIYPLNAETEFHSVELKGNFSAEYVYPSVIKSGMTLAPVSNWNYNDGQITYQAELSESKKLMSVALWGRCYSQDTE